MKFDIDRYFRSNSCYDYMSPDELAFQDALNRDLTRDSMNREVHYHRFWKGQSRNIYPMVVVDRDGNIRAELHSFAKNERAMIKTSDIQKCMDIVLEFLTAAFDHGYLLHDEEAGHDGT